MTSVMMEHVESLPAMNMSTSDRLKFCESVTPLNLKAKDKVATLRNNQKTPISHCHPTHQGGSNHSSLRNMAFIDNVKYEVNVVRTFDSFSKSHGMRTRNNNSGMAEVSVNSYIGQPIQMVMDSKMQDDSTRVRLKSKVIMGSNDLVDSDLQ